MLGFLLKPTAQGQAWQLQIDTAAGPQVIGEFTQQDLLTFAAELESQAQVLRTTRCVLLQNSAMRINNE
jgi:hypothetical protein